MNEQDEELHPDERRAFSALPREVEARPELENRIVSVLRRRGLIRAPRPRARFGLALTAAAAGLALLAAGFLLGRALGPPRGAPAAEPRFALFLLRGEERLPERPEEEAGRVAEYRAWARGLAGAGRFVSGEKLEDRGQLLASSGGAAASGAAASEEEIRGYFVISASDFQDALSVARGCPHLRHGGRILVRPIARV